MDAAVLSPRVAAVSLWSVCALALLTAFAAVVGSAESMHIGNIVLAQHNTRWYLVTQPVAAAVFLIALVLASHGPAGQALLGPALPSRLALLTIALAMSLLAAILFLGGGSSPWSPGPAWLVLKTGLVFAAALLARRGFAGLPDGARLLIAAGAALVGFANLTVTILRNAW